MTTWRDVVKHLISCGAFVGITAFVPVGSLLILAVIYSAELSKAIERIIKALKKAQS